MCSAPMYLTAAILCLGGVIHAAILSAAQSREYDVSYDCGSSQSSNYLDPDGSGITWTPDGLKWPGLEAVSSTSSVTGLTSSVSPYLLTMRYFPTRAMNATKFCYSLQVSEGNYYLVRAVFWSGGGVTLPYKTLRNGIVRFSVIVDTYVVQEIVITLPQSDAWIEEMYVRAQSSLLKVCLSAASATSDVPFINSLELRSLGGSDALTLVSLVKVTGKPVRLVNRQDFGVSPSSTNPLIPRARDDKYDRVWYISTPNPDSLFQAAPVDAVDLGDYAGDSPPQSVVKTTVASKPFNYTVTASASTAPLTARAAVASGQPCRYYVSLLFCEINKQSVNVSGKRVFNASVTVGGSSLIPVQTVDIFDSVGAYKLLELRSAPFPTPSSFQPAAYSGDINIVLITLPNSSVSAAISAAEILQVVDSPILTTTDSTDVVAIEDIGALGKLPSLVGDPCLPLNYSYPWINCSNTNLTRPKVTAIYLSNYGLNGTFPENIKNLDRISEIYLDQNALRGSLPSDFSKLQQLKILNLSNNFLSGTIPSSLANLPALTYLNTANNNFSGPIPPALLKKNGLTFVHDPEITDPCSKDQANCAKSKPPIGLIVGIVVGVAVVFVILVLVIYYYRPCHKPPVDIPTIPDTSREVKVIIDLSAVQQFTLVEIVNITDNMLEEINDQGSFGRSVYKGDQNGLPIAVKVLPSPVGQAELHRVVALLDRVRHENLVRFVGYSDEDEQNQMLVYEFMPNGSLHAALHGSTELTTRNLTWGERLQIVLNAAQALRYLHEQKISHGAVNSKNVLLSHNLEAKLADFALNNLVAARDDLGHINVDREPAGLPAPYLENDIYGFGVVLIEVICGRLENQGLGIVDWVVREGGRVPTIVDQRLNEDSYDTESMKKMVKIALSCIDHQGREGRRSQPTITQVCEEISRIRLKTAAN